MTFFTGSMVGASLVASLFGVPPDLRTIRVPVPYVVSTSDRITSDIPSYERDRTERLVKAKLEVSGHRVQEALNKLLNYPQFTEDQRKQVLGVAIFSGAHLIARKDIAGVTATTNDEGELIFTGVNADKTRLTNIRIAYDSDENEVYLTLSQYVDRKPVSNIYNVWTKILPQIVSN